MWHTTGVFFSVQAIFLFCRVGFQFSYKRRHDWHAHGWRQGGSLAVAHVYSLLAKDNISIFIMFSIDQLSALCRGQGCT
jgi:hypothetical protein